MAITTTFTLQMGFADGITGNTAAVKISVAAFLGQLYQYVQQQPIGVAAPSSAPTCTPGTGGSMAAGNYLVKTTYVSAPQGETTPSPESVSQTVASSGTLAINSPPPSAPAQYWNAYITAVGGGTGTETLQNTNPIAIGTNYTQTAAVSPGAALPGSNTTLVWTPSLTITPIQAFFLKNNGGGNIKLNWKRTGQGSAVDVLDLMPNSFKAFVEASAGNATGGIIALTLTASAVQTAVEYAFAG